MSDITSSTGFVTFDKDGFLSLDGVRLNIRELLNKIDSKPTNYIQADMPTKFSILDWWFNPSDGVLCMAVETDIGLIWKETTFGVNSLLKSSITSGEITSAVLNNIMNDFYAKIQEIGVKLVNGELVKNNGELTNGELAFRKTKVVNYIYNGALDLPPVVQTGGKIWNRDKNGFCKIDTFSLWILPLKANGTWNFDLVYDYISKTYTASLYDKISNNDTLLGLSIIHGKDVADILREDMVFTMDVNVTKATQAYLLFDIMNDQLPNMGRTYKRSNVFNLTPGRKIEKQVLTMPNCDDIKSLTTNIDHNSIYVYLVLGNSTVGNFDNMPSFTAPQNITYTFYGFKLNKGVSPLDDTKDDFRNMSYYSEYYPKVKNSVYVNNIFGQGKQDFVTNWSVPGWCTITTYKTILNDGTLYNNRTAEEKEILSAMGYANAQYFEDNIVIRKIIWTARDSHTLPYVRYNTPYKKVYTNASFIKLIRGTVNNFYAHGAELNKWKLCGISSYGGVEGYGYCHPIDNNSTASGGGELLIAMAGMVAGHIDLTNPSNWRVF